MDSGSTTGVTNVEVSPHALAVLDSCLGSLFHQALQTGSQALLAIHKELTDVRQALQPHQE